MKQVLICGLQLNYELLFWGQEFLKELTCSKLSISIQKYKNLFCQTSKDVGSFLHGSFYYTYQDSTASEQLRAAEVRSQNRFSPSIMPCSRTKVSVAAR